MIWWDKWVGNWYTDGFSDIDFDIYLGSYYRLDFGEVYLSYVEMGAFAGAELLGVLLGGAGPWVPEWVTPLGPEGYQESWDDEIYYFRPINLFPLGVQEILGE